jgi:phosphoribosylformylglycinamidine synthase
MKAHVYVTPKKTVLDPQGQTIRRALNGMGHPEIGDVRQGKYFEVDLADGLSLEKARSIMEQIAEEVLSNPVIEEYRVEIAG